MIPVATIRSQDFVIPIIALGAGWLAVDKPANLSVHNDPGRDLCTIIQHHIELSSDLRCRLGYHEAYGVHPVHRLDRETSGVIILACRKTSFRQLAEQFAGQTVRKKYIALLHGSLDVPESVNGMGEWSWSLSPGPGGRNRPAGNGPKQICMTRFHILRYSPHYTMVACEPQTGRRHQIRRHAALAGHAVVGDGRYGPRRALQYLAGKQGFNRLALHCQSLLIQVPEASDPVTVQSMEGADEIDRLFDGDV